MIKKICVLGDMAVGKTSLIRRLIDQTFDNAYHGAVGADVSVWEIETCPVYIWDIAGGTPAHPTYLTGASGALLVCDVTRMRTLHRISAYARHYRSAETHGPLIIAASKVDTNQHHVINKDHLDELCDKLNLHGWLFTSAKTGLNVRDAFRRVIGPSV